MFLGSQARLAMQKEIQVHTASQVEEPVFVLVVVITVRDDQGIGHFRMLQEKFLGSHLLIYK